MHEILLLAGLTLSVGLTELLTWSSPLTATSSVFVLAGCAACGAALPVRAPGGRSVTADTPFYVAAAVLAPPALIPLLPLPAIAANAARSGKRRPQHIAHGALNITLSLFAAHLVARQTAALFGNSQFGGLFVAGVAVTAVAVLINYAILRLWMASQEGRPPTLKRLAPGLDVQLALAALGWLAAMMIERRGSPWLIPFSLAPLPVLYGLMRLPQLESEARVDFKTGLYNMRHFEERMRSELARAERSGLTVHLLAMDLDHFREVNNTYGHFVGDGILQAVADSIRGAIRESDVAARFGGEEFFVLLGGVDTAHAAEIAQRIRASIAVTSRRAGAPVTVSIGIASYPSDAADGSALLRAADQALYQAKARGRNRVIIQAA